MSLALAVTAAVLAVVGLVLVLAWPHLVALFSPPRQVPTPSTDGPASHRASLESSRRIVRIPASDDFKWTAQTGPFEVVPPQPRGGHR